MRFYALVKWIGAGTFVLGVAGSATAQPASGGPVAPGAAPGTTQQPLSPKEASDQGQAIVDHVTQAAGGVAKELAVARQQRDVVKSLCLSDKLSQIDATVRSCRERNTSLGFAVAHNDVELVKHEFTMLSLLGQRGNQLVAEANQCIGQDTAFVGQTQISTTSPNGLPNEDVTLPEPTPGLVTAPPPPATPTKPAP